MSVSLFDDVPECPPVEEKKVSVPIPPGRYRVSILGGRHSFTTSALLDVLVDHGDGTVTVRTVQGRYVRDGYVNRVPVSGDEGDAPWQRVFEPVGGDRDEA